MRPWSFSPTQAAADRTTTGSSHSARCSWKRRRLALPLPALHNSFRHGRVKCGCSPPIRPPLREGSRRTRIAVAASSCVSRAARTRRAWGPCSSLKAWTRVTTLRIRGSRRWQSRRERCWPWNRRRRPRVSGSGSMGCTSCGCRCREARCAGAPSWSRLSWGTSRRPSTTSTTLATGSGTASGPRSSRRRQWNCLQPSTTTSGSWRPCSRGARWDRRCSPSSSHQESASRAAWRRPSSNTTSRQWAGCTALSEASCRPRACSTCSRRCWEARTAGLCRTAHCTTV
mmetsp:Transcript_99682/g.281403  ORF Transcript_99682/g.281403 Transcript_99682/m.281403 type:complete len:285 (-) Transcript_99682:1907-2761(-)